MDRATVYTQEQGRSVDFLFAQRAAMIGLGKLAQAAFGSSTVVRGLPVTPNSPAALNVLVGIGEIYAVEPVDATPWGSLPADTTDTILKQGLNMAALTVATPAPATSGFSVCYLIEAQYQDQDNAPAVLPFYNSANPSIPLNGQGGSGAAMATERQGVCVIQAKVGIPAATGTQVAPAVDAGWTALAVVTVANGATTVSAGNIAIPAGVPQVSSILQMMQADSTTYGVDTNTAGNAITVALTPPLTSYIDGQRIRFRSIGTNTGPVTINAGAGAIALVGPAGALQGGELVPGQYEAVYDATSGNAILMGQGAGARQTAPATQSEHAVQLGQMGGQYIGSLQVLSSVSLTAAMATFTVGGRPVQATTARFRGQAAGGGGGGALPTGAAQASAGGGGNAGNPFECVASSLTFPISITVGAPGVGSLGIAGTFGVTGGDLVIGSYATIKGGLGGPVGGLVGTFPAFNGLSGQGANPSSTFAAGVKVLNDAVGQVGGVSTLLAASSVSAGQGGSGPYGSATTGAGGEAGYGVGGVAALNGASAGSGKQGGTGQPALLMVDFFS